MTNGPSTEPYGEKLANQVANYLEREVHHCLAYNHRDYCGPGFYFDGEKYYYTEFYESRPYEKPIFTFEKREDFVRWLAAQSDRDMLEKPDGRAFFSQVISRERLQKVLAGEDIPYHY